MYDRMFSKKMRADRPTFYFHFLRLMILNKIKKVLSSDSFTILGLWVLGLGVTHFNESNCKLMSPEHFFLNDVTSLQYLNDNWRTNPNVIYCQGRLLLPCVFKVLLNRTSQILRIIFLIEVPL